MPRVPIGFRDFVSGESARLAIAAGLYEVLVGPRVALDLLVTADCDLLVFLRIDGEVLLELATAGVA